MLSSTADTNSHRDVADHTALTDAKSGVFCCTLILLLLILLLEVCLLLFCCCCWEYPGNACSTVTHSSGNRLDFRRSIIFYISPLLSFLDTTINGKKSIPKMGINRKYQCVLLFLFLLFFVCHSSSSSLSRFSFFLYTAVRDLDITFVSRHRLLLFVVWPYQKNQIHEINKLTLFYISLTKNQWAYQYCLTKNHKAYQRNEIRFSGRMLMYETKSVKTISWGISTLSVEFVFKLFVSRRSTFRSRHLPDFLKNRIHRP